jgi:hypothetical protein
MTFDDVVKYRKDSALAREAFLEHLSGIYAKQSAITEADYTGALTTIVNSEIPPEARKFKNRMAEIYKKMFGSLATKALAYVGGSGAGMQILVGLSWGFLLHLAGMVGAAGVAIAQTGVEAKISERSARRECAISYVLGLDK